ncbi:MAG TPA: hypothetical protein VFH51_15315 [Myxococcota bacterium]|nr:hypothetical protein [Myxococcota bacterium]
MHRIPAPGARAESGPGGIHPPSPAPGAVRAETLPETPDLVIPETHALYVYDAFPQHPPTLVLKAPLERASPYWRCMFNARMVESMRRTVHDGSGIVPTAFEEVFDVVGAAPERTAPLSPTPDDATVAFAHAASFLELRDMLPWTPEADGALARRDAAAEDAAMRAAAQAAPQELVEILASRHFYRWQRSGELLALLAQYRPLTLYDALDAFDAGAMDSLMTALAAHDTASAQALRRQWWVTAGETPASTFALAEARRTVRGVRMPSLCTSIAASGGAVATAGAGGLTLLDAEGKTRRAPCEPGTRVSLTERHLITFGFSRGGAPAAQVFDRHNLEPIKALEGAIAVVEGHVLCIADPRGKTDLWDLFDLTRPFATVSAPAGLVGSIAVGREWLARSVFTQKGSQVLLEAVGRPGPVHHVPGAEAACFCGERLITLHRRDQAARVWQIPEDGELSVLREVRVDSREPRLLGGDASAFVVVDDDTVTIHALDGDTPAVSIPLQGAPALDVRVTPQGVAVCDGSTIVLFYGDPTATELPPSSPTGA